MNHIVPTLDGFFFDEDKARRAVEFIELLRQWKGPEAGQPLKLLPWQHRLVSQVFGCVGADGLRQYRTVFTFIPRKGGKTTLAGAIALALLFIDGEEGAEIYGAANDRDQASICFDVAAGMVKRSPELSSISRIIDHTKRIINPASDSFYRAISADAAGSHGFNASGVVFDELHTQRNRDLWDVLTTSTAARAQPLVIAITTAGWDRKTICWEVYDYAKKVHDGIIGDPTFLPVIFEADEDDDWTDPDTWMKANPGLGTTVPISYFETECAKAQEMPAAQNTFRRLLLNQWTEQESRWLDMTVWDRCNTHVDPEELAGRPCYAGLDLSTTTDLSAFVLVFPPEEAEEPFQVISMFWVPKENAHARARRDGVPYVQWIQDGLITATEGNVVDYDFIRRDINELGEVFDIREIAIDRWNATQITTQLDGDGFTVCEFGQGFRDMGAPTKELERLILGEQIAHSGHPVLRWMASNVAVKSDPAGNLKPAKDKSTDRIDGIVALVMGIARATGGEVGGRSVYEDGESLWL